LGAGRREREQEEVRWRTAGLSPFIGAEGAGADGLGRGMVGVNGDETAPS
jgi:hypothetical protein